MAVFTSVDLSQAQRLADRLQLGAVTELKGIKGGIENTNYFLTTEQGAYVLTLFERLSHEQLPFYLFLMKHLAHKGVSVPDPVADAHGEILFEIQGKPAALVKRLSGGNVLSPDAHHCATVGAALAQMHLAGQDYHRTQPNLRGLNWWVETAPLVRPHLSEPQLGLLNHELAYQQHVAQSAAYQGLPSGPIHADLFRDNVMFDQDHLSGFFDFYFAGVDHWVFDLCVCLNDWCIDLNTGRWDLARRDAMVSAYQSVRPLQPSERQLFPAMARAAALRFWISRLWDFYLPREASLLQPHDPTHFERVLRCRTEQAWSPA
ncbi:MAG: homoserine kinase [Alphaproteobacteria bacterium]|nr:homoserine kinase [Alphaproteobacteria bacterium]